MKRDARGPMPSSPGRPQGSRNRLQTKFLYDLAEDWEANGAACIRVVRIEDPAKYMTIVAALMPKELQIETSVLADLSDEDILDALARIRKMKETPAVDLSCERLADVGKKRVNH
jgi:hypothetical protein